MAQIADVALTIVDVSRQNPTGLNPHPQLVKKVTITATGIFTPEEVGLTYRLHAAVYASDRPSDDQEAIPLFALHEDAGVEKLADIAGCERFQLFQKSYREFVVTSTTMSLYEERNILVELLDEDPGFIFLPGGPPFRIKLFEDELFARVTISVVADSIVEPERTS